MNLRRSGQREGGGCTGLGFFVAAGKSSGCPSRPSVLSRREIQARRVGSDPRARRDSLQSLLPPPGIAGKVQASEYSPYGETTCPDLTSNPTTRRQSGTGQDPAGLTPSSPPNAQLGTARLRPKSFQLTLSLPALRFLKRKIKCQNGCRQHPAGARLTPTPRFNPPCPESPWREKRPATQAAFSGPEYFPVGWLRDKRHPRPPKREGKR